MDSASARWGRESIFLPRLASNSRTRTWGTRLEYDHISINHETVLEAYPLKTSDEDIAKIVPSKIGLATVTAESEKVRLSGFVVPG